MYNIALICWNELKLKFRKKSIYIELLIMPILLIFVLGSSLSGYGGFQREERPLTIANAGYIMQDSDRMKQPFEQWSADDQVLKFVHFTPYTEEDELRQDLRNQHVDYGVIIPAFDPASSTPPQIRTIRGSNATMNITMEMVLQSYTSSLAFMQYAAASGITDPQQLASIHTSQPKSPVKVGSTNYNMLSAIQYYTVSIMIMFLMYSGLSLVSSIHMERENHTLSRIMATPVLESQLIFGKLISNFIIRIMQVVMICATSALLFGVDWSDTWYLALLVTALVTISSLCIGIIASGMFKTTKVRRGFIQALVVGMVALSGGFAVIPDLINTVGIYTLPYWGMQAIMRSLMHASSSDVQAALLTLTFITGALGLASFFFRKAVVR